MRKYVDGVYSDMTDSEVQQANKMSDREEIRRLKRRLAETDYFAIKFLEGCLSEEKFAAIKAERKKIREKINILKKRQSIG